MEPLSIPHAPPQTVVVMGAPQTGKTTLIRSLVKSWTQRSLERVDGPITIVLGQKRRLTLFECPNELGAMIDLAKVTDIAVLVVDCKVGFEMEHMEYLNLLQNHGFCHVTCVLTNCESYKNQKSLRKRVKELKKRFWTEVVDGAKVFALSKLVHNSYPKKEVLLLARHISGQKTKPTQWRSSHPFVFVDRWDDVTPSNQLINQESDGRQVAAFGWIRGGNFLPGSFAVLHSPGLGDFQVKEVDLIDDPIPPPSKSRYLPDRDRVVYAPRGDVGSGIMVEKDSIYIKVPDIVAKGSQGSKKETDDVIEGRELIRSLKEGVVHDSENEFSNSELSEEEEPEEKPEEEEECIEEDEKVNHSLIETSDSEAEIQPNDEESEFSEVDLDQIDDDTSQQSAAESESDSETDREEKEADQSDGEGVKNEEEPVDNVLIKKTNTENDPVDIVNSGGHLIGSYVRIVLSNVPSTFLDLEPSVPIILGVVPIMERDSDLGPVWTKVRKHRWYNRLLKSNDPIVISIGWRRFQTRAVFSRADLGEGFERHRYLKYSPEHDFCNMMFTSPCFPPNTPFVGFISDKLVKGFRISATGVLLENRPVHSVVKKLKVVGEPKKIMKNTAFISGMFSSQLEASKFEGAMIRTVSGVRGQIKKAARQPPGLVRVSFEDKILMSDIVFLKTWVPVSLPFFYHPMIRTSLFRLMKTVGQLRAERNKHAPVEKDSLYLPIERQERHFNPLFVPPSLQAKLPFASKPKLQQKRHRKTVEQRRPVFADQEEVERKKLVMKLQTSANEKQRKYELNKEQNLKKKQKIMAREEEERAKVTRKRKAEVMAAKSRKMGRVEED
ncbi:hypothetical protein P9112_008876 [Eukaryota sp. TZLM1-RC]